jgi:hypothetical protein
LEVLDRLRVDAGEEMERDDRRRPSHNKRLDVADRHIAYTRGDKYVSNLPVPPISKKWILKMARGRSRRWEKALSAPSLVRIT